MRKRPSLAARAVLAIGGAFAAAPLAAQARETHWAFVPPVKRVPAVRGEAWCRDDIDRCVLAGLERDGTRANPPADPAVLLRRVHLVLTGLPPTPAQVAAFAADASDAAYARAVDALLLEDACAEHLATDWLDLARFADTYGYQADFECRTWPWRDWLLHAIASDMPWDRFVNEVVAGDLIDDATTSTRSATAFWRLHRQTNEGGSIAEEWRHEYIADRVDTLGAAFLGLTLGCARCHDHKYDPISQRDYYSLGSFFAIDEAGLYPYSTGATPQPAIRLTTTEQDGELARLRQVAAVAESVYELVFAVQVKLLEDSPGAIAQPPAPIARFRLDHLRDGGSPDEVRSTRVARVPPECRLERVGDVDALTFDGDARVVVPDLPAFTRDDAFSVSMRLWCPDCKPRAVILHTSHYTEDADTQGYQLLLKDGRLCWEIVHDWPGSAIALRAQQALPLQQWVTVAVTYDGSSRAAGMAIWVDGVRADADVVRDELTGPCTVRQLELGGRDRDAGFAGGRISDLCIFDECLMVRATGPQATPADVREYSAAHTAEVIAAANLRREARCALHRTEERLPELMVMAPNPHPPERFVLRRGAYDQPDLGRPVHEDVPAAVLPFDGAWPRDRRGLASWLVDPANPLAARVAVDRLWAKCFGRGLVPTPENFGKSGTPPVQQVLLDALAFDFAQDRSVKRLLRRIVLSATFRQSSAATPAQREADPYDDRLARGPSFRLSAEALRDQALAASGLLHRQLGGPSVKPWQPPGLWRDAGAGWGGADYKPDTGPAAHRRSLYTYRKRTAPPPDMTAFDGGNREVCMVRRQETNTPLQALVALGDPVFTECAQALAKQALALPDADLDARLTFVFVSLCARSPREPELAALRTLHGTDADALRASTLVASTVMASDAAMVVR